MLLEHILHSWWPPTAAGPCGGHWGTAAVALEEAKPGLVLRTLSRARSEEGSTVRGSRAFPCAPGCKHRLRMRQHALSYPFLHHFFHWDCMEVLKARSSYKNWPQNRALKLVARSLLPILGRTCLIWVKIEVATWVFVSWPQKHHFSYTLHNWLSNKLI